MPDGWQSETKTARGAMFARILAAIDDVSEIRDVFDLVKDVADPEHSQVRALHLRLRRADDGELGASPLRARRQFP
jgi:hypothetical protein